jgi:phosphoribosylformimino-5-aminoimidazole carboxamide ribotide isomerase
MADKIILQMPTTKSSCFRMVEESDEDLPFIQNYQAKVQYVICTDIAKDGMLEGPF